MLLSLIILFTKLITHESIAAVIAFHGAGQTMSYFMSQTLSKIA